MVSIQATLEVSKSIQSSITGVSNTNGTGVNFNVNFYQFPSSGAPFHYYIADAAVPPSLSCASLTTPLNPYSATSSSCTATSPSACAIGALSSKHGTIASGADGADFSFQKFYLDLYLSTIPGSKAYFGGRAIVIADKEGKPVNCATFPGVASAGGSSSSAAGGTASTAFSFVSGSSTSASAAASTAFSFVSGSSTSASAAASTAFSFASGSSTSTSATASAATSSVAAAALAQSALGKGSVVGMGMVAAVAALVL